MIIAKATPFGDQEEIDGNGINIPNLFKDKTAIKFLKVEINDPEYIDITFDIDGTKNRILCQLYFSRLNIGYHGIISTSPGNNKPYDTDSEIKLDQLNTLIECLPTDYVPIKVEDGFDFEDWSQKMEKLLIQSEL